jgi:hypothetical protein
MDTTNSILVEELRIVDKRSQKIVSLANDAMSQPLSNSVEGRKTDTDNVSFKMLLIMAVSCMALSGRYFTTPSEIPHRTKSCVD